LSLEYVFNIYHNKFHLCCKLTLHNIWPKEVIEENITWNHIRSLASFNNNTKLIQNDEWSAIARGESDQMFVKVALLFLIKYFT